MNIRASWLAVAAILGTVSGSVAFGQGPANVLLVINGNSQDSRAIGDYYRQKRNIPEQNVCTLAAPSSEAINNDAYNKTIRGPIAKCILDHALQDKILYIVLTKGVPLTVDEGSVDSALTLLYTTFLGVGTPKVGKVLNPSYAHNTRGTVRFSHKDFTIYLVTRLDAYDVADAKALIDRGLAAVPAATPRDARFLFDEKASDETPGNGWLADAASRLHATGVPMSRITLDTGSAFLTGQDKVMGYASWGSNDPADKSRFLQNHWLPGALMAEFVSTDARTFERPPEKWTIGTWKDSKKSFFHDSPQSLIADYIHEGVTGVAGNVSEPMLDACVRPQMLFPAYVQGLNLAESFYASLPYLNWKSVVIGDPLVSPFASPLAKDAVPADELDPPTSALGLPSFFSRHLVAARAKALGETPEVTELLMMTERLALKKDIAGARQTAERALKLAPDSAHALDVMAQLSPPAQAIELYQRVVEIAPQNATALNNLAYMMAGSNQVRAALPFAARAADITQGRQGRTLDTYGWILYLLDQTEEGCPTLQKALALEPSSADVTYHVGMCLLKQGKKPEARAQLERALTLHPDAALAAAIRKSL